MLVQASGGPLVNSASAYSSTTRASASYPPIRVVLGPAWGRVDGIARPSPHGGGSLWGIGTSAKGARTKSLGTMGKVSLHPPSSQFFFEFRRL